MKHWIGRVAAVIGGLLTLLLVYGVLIEPRLILDVERADVVLAQLPETADGTEVALITDLQVGMWWANEGMVERAVEEIVEDEPDVALLGGDFVYSSSPSVDEQVDTVLDLLDPLLQSGISTFAVLGNHDYAVGAAEEVATALEAAGVTVLRNEAAPVPGTGTGAAALHVVGVGPVVPGELDIDAALADVPDGAPRIVLSHNPTVLDEFPAGTAPLALAGHTHCGQIALPGTPHWAYLALTEEEKIVAEGWAPEDYAAEGNRLFVTCGTGFSVVPVRINAPPEIAFFTLRSEG
ncbi:metallophosphoesterase [Blastococcus saxobsidens]|uniref:Metallophosphoesterase n=1 Tax=Blastococcus saxobsidens (strain DD2) TaxID=1146883 RepID=H6RMI5_BLASD|nr:metallophosphoesterase [Blastococcus saxobsidens]CCG03820.1 Metallophosphoesterase [Blastococcus saxobsidens DD2]